MGGSHKEAYKAWLEKMDLKFTLSSTGFWGKDLSDIIIVCCLIQEMRESIWFWYSNHLVSTSYRKRGKEQPFMWDKWLGSNCSKRTVDKILSQIGERMRHADACFPLSVSECCIRVTPSLLPEMVSIQFGMGQGLRAWLHIQQEWPTALKSRVYAKVKEEWGCLEMPQCQSHRVEITQQQGHQVPGLQNSHSCGLKLCKSLSSLLQ